MNKRYFTDNNIHKLDGLLRWLSDKKILYCVSWSIDHERGSGEVLSPRAVITWYEG
jgi:hypothetical protein